LASLTRDDAQRIVSKLKATVRTSRRAHDLAEVWEGDKIVVRFGIRRGSSKDTPHGHIPHDLFLRPHEAKDLARCPLGRAEYLKILAQRMDATGAM